MSSVAPRTPLPTATPLSSKLYRDCVQHAQSVLATNERKALQLRPVLERRRSGSVLSDSSSASPPSSPDDTRFVDVNQRQPNSPFIDPTQPHQIAIMVVSVQSPHGVYTRQRLRCAHLTRGCRKTASSISTPSTPRITFTSTKPAARCQRSLVLALNSSCLPRSTMETSPSITNYVGTVP